MHPRELKLGEALVRLKVIDELQLASAVASADQWGQRLTEALLGLRLARETALVDAVASVTRTEKIDLGATSPEPAALDLLDPQFCQKHGVLPFALTENGRTLHVAMADPSNLALSDLIAARARARVRRFVAGETTIQKAVQRYYLGMEQVSLEPAPDELPISELQEIKLVDITGRTLNLKEAVVAVAKAGNSGQANPAAAAASVGPSSGPAASPSPLDPPPKAAPREPEPAGDATPPVALEMGEVLQAGQLEAAVEHLKKEVGAIRQTQESTDRALRALIGLLLERKHFTAEELRARMSRNSRGGS